MSVAVYICATLGFPLLGALCLMKYSGSSNHFWISVVFNEITMFLPWAAPYSW